MTTATDADDVLPEEDLTDAHRAVIRQAYAAPYDDLAEDTQRQARRVLGDMPQPILDVLDGNHRTAEQVKDAMNHVFKEMKRSGDWSDANLTGAAVLAKGVEKRLDLDGAEVAP